VRVLFVISALGFGGAERQVVLLSRELSRLGHAVLIYTLNARVPRESELEGSGAELFIDQKRSRLDWAVIRRLRRSIRAWRADVVHSFLFDADIYSRLAGWGLPVPVLNSARNDNWQPRRLTRLGYALTSAGMRAIVANSWAGARYAQSLHGVDASRVHVVWNGIDLEQIDERLAASPCPALELWPESGVRRVAIVGAIKPQKDHALALHVAAALHRRTPSWRFLFVGDSLHGHSAHREQVLAQCRALGADAFSKFVGIRRDVPEIMASCDALLVTSHFEGFPNVVLEAMACGCPVASTDYSDVKRILPFAWQVAASRRPEELANIVERCVVERDEVCAAQRRWVETHATTQRSAAALLAVYESYLHRRDDVAGSVAH
jgi:glycosyltransferase involved in cell wall biosynthesis